MSPISSTPPPSHRSEPPNQAAYTQRAIPPPPPSTPPASVPPFEDRKTPSSPLPPRSSRFEPPASASAPAAPPSAPALSPIPPAPISWPSIPISTPSPGLVSTPSAHPSSPSQPIPQQAATHISGVFQNPTRTPIPPKRYALLVDDDPSALRTFHRILSRYGVEVLTSANVAGVADLLRPLPASSCVVAFVDVLMPSMVGPRFVSSLRAQPAFGLAPVVLVSGLNAHVLEQTVKDWGASGYILKMRGLLHVDHQFAEWLERQGLPPTPPARSSGQS
ncbi:MAG: response regulator [Polyangiaceae bacterium]